MTLTDFKQDIIRWNCQKVGELGGILELTLQPNMKVTEIPDQMYLDIAIFLRRMNADYGVPILLRFMHEMVYMIIFCYLISFRMATGCLMECNQLPK